MKTGAFYLVFAVMIIMCCGLSKCNHVYVDDPIPETRVHGVVTDFNTGKPIARYKLLINNGYTGLYSQDRYKEYDTIYTKADGRYDYSFIPVNNYALKIIPIENPNYIYNYPNFVTDVKLGADSEINIVLQKMINLTLHFVNNSGHTTYNSGQLSIQGCCYINAYEFHTPITPKKLDTIIRVKIPDMSAITLYNTFYDRYPATTPNITTTYKFSSGKNDTTVTVINP